MTPFQNAVIDLIGGVPSGRIMEYAATRASLVDRDEKGLRDEASELPNPISPPPQRFGQLRLALFRFHRQHRV